MRYLYYVGLFTVSRLVPGNSKHELGEYIRVRWKRFIRKVGGRRILIGLGGLYVIVGSACAVFVLTTGRPLLAALVDFLLVGLPGVFVLAGGLRLPRIDIDTTTYPRIVTWCLVGFLVVLSGIELLNLEPGVEIAYPRWSFILGSAFGIAGGFAVGVNDARALSRAQEIRDQNQRLQQQNDRLESFARMVAHELKNPLSIAQIYLTNAKRGDADAFEKVSNAHDRIEEMIEMILVTATGTTASIERETVALATVAREAWADLPVEDADLIVETDQTLRADSIHLRHLFENLFKNAVEHSTDPVTVRVGSLPTGFYVEDDGPGIPEDEREQVFEPGHTTDRDGIGMGLTFVSQLADAYGWDCTVTTGSQGGARFEFTDVELASSEEKGLDEQVTQ